MTEWFDLYCDISQDKLSWSFFFFHMAQPYSTYNIFRHPHFSKSWTAGMYLWPKQVHNSEQTQNWSTIYEFKFTRSGYTILLGIMWWRILSSYFNAHLTPNTDWDCKWVKWMLWCEVCKWSHTEAHQSLCACCVSQGQGSGRNTEHVVSFNRLVLLWTF